MSANDCVLSDEDGTIVTCNPAANVRLSTLTSGNTPKSLKPIDILPALSNDFSLSHAKSLTRGSTKCTNLSIKSNALSHLKVVLSITGVPSLNLKLLTEVFEFIITGF